MKQYKFIGDPRTYFWDFPLVPGSVYSGDTVAFNDETILEILNDVATSLQSSNEALKQDANVFLAEWEEVTNDL